MINFLNLFVLVERIVSINGSLPCHNAVTFVLVLQIYFFVGSISSLSFFHASFFMFPSFFLRHWSLLLPIAAFKARKTSEDRSEQDFCLPCSKPPSWAYNKRASSDVRQAGQTAIYGTTESNRLNSNCE